MLSNNYFSIFIDADDVLWRDNAYYERASKFLYDNTELKKRWKYSTFIRRLDHIEAERCSKIKHYAEKEYIQSVKIFCARYKVTLDKNTEHFLRRILQSRQKPEVYPKVAATLQKLVKYGVLYLYTKGRKLDYKRKLKEANLDIFFSGIVSGTKTTVSLKKLLLRYRLRPSDTIVIGDSYTNDIDPALAIRMHTIYVCNDEAWTPENAVPVHKKVRVVKHFYQVLATISSFL